MNGDSIQIVIAFIIADLMVILLLPSACALPKNLVDQLWLWQKDCIKGSRNQRDLRNRVIKFFSATDILTFGTISYAVVALIFGTCGILLERDVLCLQFFRWIALFLGFVYFGWIACCTRRVRKWRLMVKDSQRSENPKVLQGICEDVKCVFQNGYLCLIWVVSILLLVVCVLFGKSWPRLLLSIWIILIICLASWLIPHFHYMPMSSLLKLRGQLTDKEKTN